jgi:hypothetical protein
LASPLCPVLKNFRGTTHISFQSGKNNQNLTHTIRLSIIIFWHMLSGILFPRIGLFLVTYDDLATAIIKKKIATLGKEAAITTARKSGVVCDDDGKCFGTTKSSLGALVDAYAKVSGRVGIIFARSAILKLIEGSQIDLPDILK